MGRKVNEIKNSQIREDQGQVYASGLNKGDEIVGSGRARVMTPFIGSIDADKGDELIISRDYQGPPSADKKVPTTKGLDDSLERVYPLPV